MNSHDIYHRAREQLFANLFVFHNFGSDLKEISKSIGLLKCRKLGCKNGNGSLTFTDVVFVLGDPSVNFIATWMVHAFACALGHLRVPMQIRRLTIDLDRFCIGSEAKLQGFAYHLINVTVLENFRVRGWDHHLRYGVRCLGRSLSMNAQPVISTFVPGKFVGDGAWHSGRFEDIYLPAQSEYQLVPQQDQLVTDATYKFEHWMEITNFDGDKFWGAMDDDMF